MARLRGAARGPCKVSCWGGAALCLCVCPGECLISSATARRYARLEKEERVWEQEFEDKTDVRSGAAGVLWVRSQGLTPEGGSATAAGTDAASWRDARAFRRALAPPGQRGSASFTQLWGLSDTV